MLNEESGQLNIYGNLLETLVKPDHAYRTVLQTVDFKSFCKPLETAFKCILLQQWEDLSDRQMERFLQENNAAKLFCGFGLLDQTPDHSFFGRVRDRVGIDKMVELFNRITKQLKSQNVVSEAFTFVDSTSVISKLSIWKERQNIAREIPSKIKSNTKKYLLS